MNGRTHSLETKQKIHNAHIGKKKTPEHVAAILRASFVRPNRAERQLGVLLDRLFPGHYRYVGDGQLIIGGKCPDFVNVNGQKKLVELFGDYWHRRDSPEARAAVFTPFGYQTLVVWEHELDDMALATVLRRFHEETIERSPL